MRDEPQIVAALLWPEPRLSWLFAENAIVDRPSVLDLQTTIINTTNVRLLLRLEF